MPSDLECIAGPQPKNERPVEKRPAPKSLLRCLVLLCSLYFALLHDRAHAGAKRTVTIDRSIHAAYFARFASSSLAFATGRFRLKVMELGPHLLDQVRQITWM